MCVGWAGPSKGISAPAGWRGGGPCDWDQSILLPQCPPWEQAGPGCARGVLLAPLEQAPSGSGGCQEIKNDFLPCFQTQQARLFTECLAIPASRSAGLPLLCCCCGSCLRGCPLCSPLEELPFGGASACASAREGTPPSQSSADCLHCPSFGLVWAGLALITQMAA